MLLSVLIPTYNYDCLALVRELLGILPLDAEIWVGDDASTDAHTLEVLEEIRRLANCNVWHAEHNLGRAGIRNRLAEQARGEWLLFMDSDARVPDKHFLERYIQRMPCEVICGGTTSPEVCPAREVSLRYAYEHRYWQKHDAERRAERPYDSFTTFNFCIRRSTFLQIGFNEACKRYGHEDTLFGMALKEGHIPLLHIDNALIHTGLETNGEFMRKTEEGLTSLLEMETELADTSRLLKLCRRLQARHMTGGIRWLYRLTGGLLRRNLCSNAPFLPFYNLYKLGYFLNLVAQSDRHKQTSPP